MSERHDNEMRPSPESDVTGSNKLKLQEVHYGEEPFGMNAASRLVAEIYRAFDWPLKAALQKRSKALSLSPSSLLPSLPSLQVDSFNEAAVWSVLCISVCFGCIR